MWLRLPSKVSRLRCDENRHHGEINQWFGREDEVTAKSREFLEPFAKSE